MTNRDAFMHVARQHKRRILMLKAHRLKAGGLNPVMENSTLVTTSTRMSAKFLGYLPCA
jgi:hypothetical protein